MPIRIHQLSEDDVELQQRLGELTVSAYRPLMPDIDHDGYAEELADVAGRVAGAVVLVALDDGDAPAADVLLGGVTYVGDPSSPYAEFRTEGAAGIRMLAVSPAARRRGVGELLVRACLERAAAEGRHRVELHTVAAMVDAHRLYERMGFVRDEALDEHLDGYHLMAYRTAVGAAVT